uniref:H-2 class II histocompatibility antigen gamma chain-like n=1 Tax=Cyprinus carpio TaxID=7962 RepID=A0A8C1PLG9_CYPCA
MDEHQDQALFQRVPSQETVVNRGGTGGSNGKALKVTGLTVLACLLLAGQALTAYLVWGQKEHISALTTGQEKLKTELTRKMSGEQHSRPFHQIIHVYYSGPIIKCSSQKIRELNVSSSRLMPKQMQLPMRSLPLLMDTDDDVKSTPESAVEVQSKCQLESQKQMKPGFYKPQCDEQGNYLPMQCWHSTGYCWCVDKNGNEIPGTSVRGRRPDCS